MYDRWIGKKVRQYILKQILWIVAIEDQSGTPFVREGGIMGGKVSRAWCCIVPLVVFMAAYCATHSPATADVFRERRTFKQSVWTAFLSRFALDSFYTVFYLFGRFCFVSRMWSSKTLNEVFIFYFAFLCGVNQKEMSFEAEYNSKNIFFKYQFVTEDKEMGSSFHLT